LVGAVSCHQEAFSEQLTQPLPGEIFDELRWHWLLAMMAVWIWTTTTM
jgi:hypothetical protein